MKIHDRIHAGAALARLIPEQQPQFPMVLGLARGGVMVAREISRHLLLPFDVLVVKKIGSPGNAEFALGALAPDGVIEVNWKTVSRLGIDERYVWDRKNQLGREIENMMRLYRKGKKPLTVNGRTVILVDDGAATGSTLEAAIRWCKAKKASKIIVAVAVAHPSVKARILPEVSMFVSLAQPKGFVAVGQFYTEFPQLTDENVIELLL